MISYIFLERGRGRSEIGVMSFILMPKRMKQDGRLLEVEGSKKKNVARRGTMFGKHKAGSNQK